MNKKDICYLELTFENIDWIRIPGEFVSEVDIQDDAARFVLKSEVCTTGHRFDGDVHSIRHEGKSVIERLMQNDITQIKLHYTDGMESDFSAVWEEAPDDEYKNQRQKAWEDQKGLLHVHIV